jgi:hypothetical protein
MPFYLRTVYPTARFPIFVMQDNASPSITGESFKSATVFD